MKVLMGMLVVIVGGALLFGGCAYTGYNKAVGLDEDVKNKWAQVENQLQRRYELIPNLVETVKGYASHEKELFENVANARTKYFSAGTPADKAEAATGVERALSRLLVLRETYPDLKANANFLSFQAQLEGTENRLSVERKRYNDAVTTLNKYSRQLLGRMFTSWAGVGPAEYFEMDEAAKAAPRVDFSTNAPASAPSP